MKKNLIAFMNKKQVKYRLRQIMLALILVLIMLLFFNRVISFLFTLALVIIASFSKIYKRFMHSIGFELVTFASIIFFFAHGAIVGFLLALLMLIASTLISSRITNAFIYQVLIYAVLAVISIFLRPLGIVSAGKVLVILYNIMLHLVGIFIINYPIHSSILNFAVNASVNFFIFEHLSEWLMVHL